MKLFTLALLCLGLSNFIVFSQEDISLEKNYIEGEMLVQITAQGSIRDLLKKAPKNYEFEIGEYISPPMRIWLVKFNYQNIPNHEFLNWLYEQEEVSIAQNNHHIKMRSTIPSDANFSQQWHHNNTGQTGGTVDADIDSDLAWDITTGGQTATNDDIVVCLIESGNLDHNDITDNRWVNQNEIPNNGIDDDANGFVDDYNGWNPVAGNDNYGTGNHGTSCLGMIGAKGNNGLLVTGANWDVKLMVVGDYNINTDANAIQAYTYPLTMRKLWNSSGGTQGAFVVATSSSWGIDAESPSGHPLWCNIYDTLGYAGVLNVGATTNSNLNVDAVGDMPTACASPYMIGVGRTDHNDATAGGYGQTTIEFGAPGINVVTTANNNTTTTTTGTSFSCPLTAGVIGLAYSIPCTDFMSIVNANPKQAADLVLQALLDGTDPIPALANKFVTGGRLNSKNTLDELMQVACSGSLCLTPSAISTDNITDNSANINFTPNASGTSTKMYWRLSGTSSWAQITNASSPVNLSGLTTCETYEYYLVSLCGADSSTNTSIQTFTTTGCGACVEASYCNNNATDVSDEWISEFSIDSYTNTSGSNGGYGDFTATSSISLNKGIAYNFTITPGWSGTLYDEYSRIWVDLDQNGTFDATDLLFDQGNANQSIVNNTITIPITATNGSTRMRVQMAYQGPGQNSLPNVCGTYQWGEIEDYCLDIQDANPCNLMVTETIGDASCYGVSDGSISLNVSGGTSGYSYNWQSSGNTASIETGLGANNYTVTVTDGANCTSTFSYTVSQPDQISESSTITDISCNGETDGSIDMTISNAVLPATYLWSPGGDTTEDISNAGPGPYTLTVTDYNGCTETFNASINEPAVLAGTTSTTLITTGTDGAINLTVTGGTPPYTYNWDNGYSTSEDLSGLSVAGTYICNIIDSKGCTIEISATVDSQVGIESNELHQLNIYPNPSHGMINIAFKAEVRANITVYSAIGEKLVETSSIGDKILTIDLNKFSSGVYVLHIESDNGEQRIERITIKK